MRIRKTTVTFSQADIKLLSKAMRLCQRLDQEFMPLAPEGIQDAGYGAAEGLENLLSFVVPNVYWIRKDKGLL